MTEAVDDKGFPCSPRNLKDDAWFYEEHKGLLVVQRGEGTRMSLIPWRKVCAAVDRYRKLKSTR